MRLFFKSDLFKMGMDFCTNFLHIYLIIQIGNVHIFTSELGKYPTKMIYMILKLIMFKQSNKVSNISNKSSAKRFILSYNTIFQLPQ